MHRETKNSVKVIYSLIGLLAVILPIFLITINFQPLGFLIKTSPLSPTPSTQPTIVTGIEPVGFSLLTKEEFTALKANPNYLVIDTRTTSAKSGILGLSATELKAAIKQDNQTQLQQLFKNQNLILVSSDLVEAKEIGTLLKGKSFLVLIYFTKEV